jgi:Ferredoxin
MLISATNLLYFSPTRTTQAIVRTIAQGVGLPTREFDFTHLSTSPATPVFGQNELAVVGLPVYMGRVPSAANAYLRTLNAEGAPCIVVGVYGNRAFDDYLVELEDILREQGFLPVAAAAFIGEHSITSALGTGRPNPDDLALATEFGKHTANKLEAADSVPVLAAGKIPGNRPYETYSAKASKKKDGEKVANGPTVDDLCTNCKLCVSVCPIDNINPDNVRDINPYECLRCHACVRNCPADAIRFLKPGFIRHVKDLENSFSKPDKTPLLVL